MTQEICFNVDIKGDEGLAFTIDTLRSMKPLMEELGNNKQSDDDKLNEAINLSRRVSEICGELKLTLPSEFNSAMQKNKDLIHDILNNLAAAKMYIDMKEYNVKVRGRPLLGDPS